MSDVQLPGAVASEVSVPVSSDRSPASSTSSDKTVITPRSGDSAHCEPLLSRGSAMFSTDLGRLAPRKLQGPPYTPVIVRSDRVQDVVTAAQLWLKKYPVQYLCIFPQSGWQIGDLWDEQDIHLETESFCKEVLKFIERDNYIRARDYAHQWSKTYPERLDVVGADMSVLYDPNDHLSIVDNIFINGEMELYPRIFLWHVAHNMRTAMLEVKGMRVPTKESASVPARLNTGVDEPIKSGAAKVLGTAEEIVAMPSSSYTKAKSSFHATDPPASMPVVHPPVPSRPDPSSERIISHGPSYQGGSHEAHAGQIMGDVQGSRMMSHPFAHPGLHVPKGRMGRSGSESYNQGIHPAPYGENMPYGASGSYPRPLSGSISMTQSPRFNSAHTSMPQPVANGPHGMSPFAYEQNMMLPGMGAGQQLPPGAMHPNMMMTHTMQMPSPSMNHGYPRYPSGAQSSPYVMPMADMTNMHFNPNMPPQNIDPPRPGERRYSQQYGNGSALYDPFEGNNPSFRHPGSQHNSRKINHNSFQNLNGRQRKPSTPGGRFHQDQFANDKPSHIQSNNSRFVWSKGPSEDDPAITQDYEYGCYTNWIGPQNTTVTEVFVGDLPEDIQKQELEALFHDRIGVKPESINLKIPFQQNGYPTRRHAFVGFSNAGSAKQAMNIRDPAIRGLSVSIKVPNRFFQKIVEVTTRYASETGLPTYSRYTSNANDREGRHRQRVSSFNEESVVTASAESANDKPAYSPQDARSDLNKKKKKARQPQQGSAVTGSPEVRKTKPKKRQESPTKKEPTEATRVGQNDAVKTVARPEEKAPGQTEVKGNTLVIEAQTQVPQVDDDLLPKPEAKAEVPRKPSPVADTENVMHTTNNDLNPSMNQARQLTPPEAAPKQATQEVETLVESAEQGPAAESTEVNDAAEKPSLPNTVSSFKPEDVASNDEPKNDRDFHSATESQFDLEPKVEARTGSDISNQGTTLSPKKTKDPATQGSKSEPSHTTANTPSENIPPSSAAESVAYTPQSEDPAMPQTDSKPTTASGPVQQSMDSSTAEPIAADPAKKGGVQHTESLHPFSKASKAQAKKEREQRRKALKKEKEQAEKTQAVKAKDSKPAAKNEPAVKSDPTDKSGPGKSESTEENERIERSEAIDRDTDVLAGKGPSLPAQDVPKPDQPAKKPTSAAKTTKGASEARDKPGKHSGKKSGSTSASVVATAESNDNHHGKQNGDTNSTTKQTGSVTKKQVKFDTSVDLAGDDLGSDVQSSKQKDINSASVEGEEPSSAPAAAASASKAPRRKKKKTADLPTVWPSLEFRPKSPNPSWMGPIDMATDVQNYDSIMDPACGDSDSEYSWSDLPGSSANSKETPATETDKDGDENEDRDNDEHEKYDIDGSQGDSAVPHAEQFDILTTEALQERIKELQAQKTALMENFPKSNEDLSTLSEPVAPESQPANKKKKKNKKRKQQSGAAVQPAETTEAVGPSQPTSDDAAANEIGDEDPFYTQLKGIEAIERGDTNLADEKNVSSQQHADSAKTLANPEFMRTLDGYLRETDQLKPKPETKKLTKEDLL